MWIDGQAYAPQSPSDAMARGVALTDQEIRLLAGLSVAENIFIGCLPVKAGRLDRAGTEEPSSGMIAALGVKVDSRRTVQGLSMAVQKEIETGKAISRKPRYLIFDEPTASLARAEAERIFKHVRALQAGGTGVIHVSHRPGEVQALADHVMCLRNGCLVAEWEGKARAQANDDQCDGAPRLHF